MDRGLVDDDMGGSRRLLPPLVLIFASVAATLIIFQVRGISDCSASDLVAVMGKAMPHAQSRAARIVAEHAAGYCRLEDLPLEPLRAVRRLSPEQLTPQLIRSADEVLFTQYPPMGAEVPIVVNGTAYVGRIETHFHEIGGAKRPWGRHRGITLYSTE